MPEWTPNRAPMRLPVTGYVTYRSAKPVKTHTREATCQEVDCQAYARGWKTHVDVRLPLGQRQVKYLRMHSGRKFTVSGVEPLLTFHFPAGQQCFAQHRVSNDRPPLYVKQGGDWRARTSEPVRMREIDWVDDFATHQQDLADKKLKG